MGFLAGIEEEAYDRNYSDVELIRRIVKYLSSQKRRVALVAGATMFTAISDLAQPLIIAQGVSILNGTPPTGLLVLLAVVVYISACMSWVTNFVRRRAAGRAVGEIVRSLRSDAFSAAVSRDMSFYDEFTSGKIISRITSDTQDFAQVVVLVTDLMSQLTLLLILIVILVTIEWHLLLMLIVFSGIVFVSALAFRQLARYVSRQASRAFANVNNLVHESIAGISVAKNFRQERAIYQSFITVNQQAYKISLRRGFVLSMVFPILNAASGIGTALLIYFGAHQVTTAVIAIGAWYLFIRSLQNFWDPLMGIVSFWSQFQAGLAAAERIFALIDAPSAVIQIDRQPVPAIQGKVEFRQVQFQYNEQEEVLRGLDLTIQPGETVAFVGHTGAGKSSIAKLIQRFYEFQGGSILIDGRDIRTFDLAEYRRHLGIVSQVPFLFNGTVIDNIRYARPEALDSEVDAIVRQIGDGEWIEMLPQGLQTDVGERGARLSMGQRQLVALSRVLVQNPSIFVLDEATASIDPFTEWQIQQALRLALANRTSILIAHRLSTVRSADRIVVLRKGEIIEQGDHDALMRNGGHYAELYNTYFRHQSLSYIETARTTLGSTRTA